MEEIIAKQWPSFSLVEEEADVVSIDESLLINEEKIHSCLLGRGVMTQKLFSKEDIIHKMNNIWHPFDKICVFEIGENLFLFQFVNEEDKNNVLLHTPWSFGEALIILIEPNGLEQPSEMEFNLKWAPFWVQVYNLPLRCMNEKVGSVIGDKLGHFLEMDDQDGEKHYHYWGRFMRIKVELDVTKPLIPKGMTLRLGASDKSFWVDFKYEGPPNFCYNCGCLGDESRDI